MCRVHLNNIWDVNSKDLGWKLLYGVKYPLLKMSALKYGDNMHKYFYKIQTIMYEPKYKMF